MKTSLLHILISCSICALVIAGYGAGYAVVGAKSAAVAALEEKIVTETDTANRIASVRESLADIEENEARIKSYFITESEVVSLISIFEEQGHTLGATISVVSVAKNGPSTQPTFSFALSVSGTFDAVMRTVGAIEYAPYDLTLSAFSLTKSDKNKWNANLTLQVGSLPTSTATSTPKI